MKLYYSPSTRGFYSDDFHGDAIPEDRVELAEERYQALLDGQASGKFIVPGEGGLPVLVDAPPESEESLRARMLAERDSRLSHAAIRIAPLQDAVDVGEATADDEALLVAWKRYRVAVNRIDQEPGFPLEFAWPERPDLAA
ncbi:phage tail protein [Achromobacter xylosoxidans]|nr:phage tail protein [Achromobacter xylosoxidans]